MIQIVEFHPAAKLEENTRFKRNEMISNDRMFDVQEEILETGLNVGIVHITLDESESSDDKNYAMFVDNSTFKQR